MRDIKCSRGASIPSYSGYFSTGKQADIDRTTQEGVLNDLNRNACWRLELGGQYPYQSYNLNLLNDSHVVDYRINGFELPRPSYDIDHHHNWASTSGSCAITMFDEHSYARQPN